MQPKTQNIYLANFGSEERSTLFAGFFYIKLASIFKFCVKNLTCVSLHSSWYRSASDNYKASLMYLFHPQPSPKVPAEGLLYFRIVPHGDWDICINNFSNFVIILCLSLVGIGYSSKSHCCEI